MNRSLNTPVALVCALALLLAAVTGAVSGTVSAKLTCEPLTAATAPALDTPTFGVQGNATNFTELHAYGPITGSGGLHVYGDDILLGDTVLAANGTQLKIDDDAQTVELGDVDSGYALIVDAGNKILNANSLKLLTKDYIVKQTTSEELTGIEPGTIYANVAATGTITMTLPGASAGLNYCFYVGAAQTLTVDPATGDLIASLTNAAGDKITNNTPGSSVCLVAADNTNWLPLSTAGTWTDAN